MKFNIITIFPEILDSYFEKGMIRIAQEKKIIKIKNINLRDFAVDKRGSVDDRPYGGGPGQVMMIAPIVKALQKTRSKVKGPPRPTRRTVETGQRSKVILLSAKGKTWNQQMAKRFAKLDEITFVCPRYEGHDERVKKFVDEEIAIGDYVLTGGELGAAVIIDSITRLLPGVLGSQNSLAEESHSKPGYKEYPQYTRPEVFEYKEQRSKIKGQRKSKDQKIKIKKMTVPKVLLSGHHKKIEEWRKSKSKIA